MKRTAIKPWPWSVELGYNQAEVLENKQHQLVCAGQTSVDSSGQPQHIDDMRGQVALALDNLETLLQAADMQLSNIIQLRIYTTDVQQTMANFDLLGQRFGAAGIRPPMTLLGVTQLALPGLMFEIEASAAS